MVSKLLLLEIKIDKNEATKLFVCNVHVINYWFNFINTPIVSGSIFKEIVTIPHENSLDDDYFSECENCKNAQSTKYMIGADTLRNEMETMTLHRKPTNIEKENDQHFRISCTLPSNPKKNA